MNSTQIKARELYEKFKSTLTDGMPLDEVEEQLDYFLDTEGVTKEGEAVDVLLHDAFYDCYEADFKD